LEWWNTGIVEGWERNLDHPGKAFFLKPIISSFRSRVERPRVQRVKAHHSILPLFQIKESPSLNHLFVFYGRKSGDNLNYPSRRSYGNISITGGNPSGFRPSPE